ncbi:MAG: NADH-ubiquinone oxidoreductase-F iron-sulfur binding region domain-containing protein [Candidatus Limnocylindrales bacterium]
MLAGPPLTGGFERLEAHRARLGELPPPTHRGQVIAVIEASGLLGRGGAGFPVGRKWRAVVEHSAGDAVAVVNGAEGEPRSAKDRALMERRPHLVLDGALVAADAVGAADVILYAGSERTDARRVMAQALAERERDPGVRVHLVAAPVGYVAGEATAVVHYLNAGDARPTFLEARPHERGVAGRPTLVQNVESLAHAALIARFGDAWYRAAGRAKTRGTALVTVSGTNARRTVREIEYGTPIGEVARLSSVTPAGGAVLLGGYFGAWAALDEVRDEPLDPATLREHGLSFGCGVVSFSGPDMCGVAATAEIMTYMAGATAAQCGPCIFGLAAIAQATRRLADGTAPEDDLERIGRWAGQVEGRGACHHPDGVIGLLRSALRVFADDFARHQARRRCRAARALVA